MLLVATALWDESSSAGALNYKFSAQQSTRITCVVVEDCVGNDLDEEKMVESIRNYELCMK